MSSSMSRRISSAPSALTTGVLSLSSHCGCSNRLTPLAAALAGGRLFGLTAPVRSMYWSEAPVAKALLLAPRAITAVNAAREPIREMPLTLSSCGCVLATGSLRPALFGFLRSGQSDDGTPRGPTHRDEPLLL